MTSRPETASKPTTTTVPTLSKPAAAVSPTTSSLHAYQVALSTLRERCRRQSEQLRVADVESRRLLADKSALLEEIAALRDTVGGHRERYTQLSAELSRQRRLAAQLLEQRSRRERQSGRRRVGAAAETAESSESGDCGGGDFETERDTDEMDVAGVTMAANYTPTQQQNSDSPISQVIGDVSTRGSRCFDEPSALVRQLDEAAEALSARNAQLRLCIEHLTRIDGASNCSLPALHDIPLESSESSVTTVNRRGPSETAPESSACVTDRSRSETAPDLSACVADRSLVCPLCRAVFVDSAQLDEFEDHVYDHLQQMVAAR